MTTKTTSKPKTYQLIHPEHGIPATAAARGYWAENGRNVGLKLRFVGEYHDRLLTYGEITELQAGAS